MKRILMTLAAALIALLSANAEEKTKTYKFGDIRSLEVGYLYEVYVTEGNSNKVTVIYEEDYEKHLTVKYRKDESKLSLELNDIPKKFKRGNQPHISVYLEMNDIASISLSGAGKATFKGTYKTDRLDLDLSGATSLRGLQINGNNMEADCSGAASLELTGNFSQGVDIDLSGAAKIDYKGNSDTLESDISGASDLYCNGHFETAKITCSGASNAELEGKAMTAEYECSGASSIDAEDFLVKTAEVGLTGASKAKVNASDDLYHDVSRASKMTYYGNAELHNMNADSNIVKGR